MPEAKLISSAAVLLVRNVETATAYYRDKLGFSCSAESADQPCSFRIMGRDGCYLMLAQAADPAHVVPHWTVRAQTSNVYFWVSDVDALHREFVDRGATIDYGLCDQPYGCREFGVQDVDSYDISFGQVIRSDF